MKLNAEHMGKIEFTGDLLDVIDASVFFINTKEEIIYANKTVEKTEGYSKEKLLGKTITEIWGVNDTPLLRALHTQTPIKNFTWRFYSNGLTITQRCNAFPWYVNGELAGAYSIQLGGTTSTEILDNNLDMQRRLFPDSLHQIPTSSQDIQQTTREEIDHSFQNIVGIHPIFLKALKQAYLAAQNDSPVMLNGPTGCGKEMFAKSIHNASHRSNHSFIAINCASIPETLLESLLFGTTKGAYTDAKDKPGLFEQAENGTLFLDEINSMPKYSQAKLLRVLEDKKVRRLGGSKEIPINVRIISSSNNLSNLNDEKNPLREDLFYRLSVVNIVIPPLTERRKDIPLLTEHFIKQLNQEFHKNVSGLDFEMSEFFANYSWPGNVRQLRNSIESAMNFVGDKDTLLRKEHLPQYLFESQTNVNKEFNKTLPVSSGIEESAPSSMWKTENIPAENVFDTIKQHEKEQIINVLLKNNGNITKSAKELNMHRQSLIHRLKKYGIK